MDLRLSLRPVLECFCQSDRKTGGLAKPVSRWHFARFARMSRSDSAVFTNGWTASAESDAPGIRLERLDEELPT